MSSEYTTKNGKPENYTIAWGSQGFETTPLFWAISLRDLALALLVTGVFTDHPDHSTTLHDFALVTDLLNRSPYFHIFLTTLSLKDSQKLGPSPDPNLRRFAYFAR